MRNRILFGIAILLAGLPALTLAEPIAFEQAANVTGLAGIEFGADVNYSLEKIKTGSATTEADLLAIPIFVRAGIGILEAKLTAPYGNVQAGLAGASKNNYSGLGDVNLMLKSAILPLGIVTGAIGLSATFPTGDPAKMLGAGQDFEPFVAVDLNALLLKLHANLAYAMRGEYDYSSTVKINPGDTFNWALGAEMPVGPLSLHAELLGSNYSTSTMNGGEIANSAGSTTTLVPGVRMNVGPLKLKLGVEIPLTSASAWPEAVPRSDWRVLAGAALQFSL